jgi:signal transduction histidine kinase
MAESLRILLVEDNPGDARLLEEHLRDASTLGATIKHVERLDAAEAQLARERPDVVLLDLSLPDAQGIDTVKGALAAAPDVPIVVLTGLDDEAVALRAVHAGAQDYLVKGKVGPALLSRSIRYAIERKQVERERQRLLAQEQEARGRAEAAVRSRDQVLQVLSHDLGNQLAAIQVYASMLVGTCPDDEKYERARTWAIGIQELTQTLQDLRENILDAAQIEAGRLSLVSSSLDVEELLESLRDQLLPLAEAKSIALSVVCAPRLPRVRGDRQRMLQALGNLAGNAIKFTPEGGEVSLRAEPLDGSLRLAVSDTGPGIAAEDLPLIFESFWKTRTDNRGGAGLGLNIAKGIVEMHGGRIDVDSVIGRGTVFSLTLPAEDRADATEAITLETS